jgi:Txe/YoeB family toxin of Txe-Axe toxin-antitoxin module
VINYKAERDTLIDDVTILKANNDRLVRRIETLEGYVCMWDKLTKWKQGKLVERSNNDLLHELNYTMNELERDMYKGRE